MKEKYEMLSILLEYYLIEECYISEDVIMYTGDCIDNRIKSKTKGCLYKGYPQEDNSNIVVDSKELEERICVGLNEYKRELENTCMRIGLFLKSKE